MNIYNEDFFCLSSIQEIIWNSHPDYFHPFWCQNLPCQLWSLLGLCPEWASLQVHELARMKTKHTKNAGFTKDAQYQPFSDAFWGHKMCKSRTNKKKGSMQRAFLQLTCTLWGSPVILRGLSAPVGMGSSWIIIICTPVLSCRSITRQEYKPSVTWGTKHYSLRKDRNDVAYLGWSQSFKSKLGSNTNKMEGSKRKRDNINIKI